MDSWTVMNYFTTFSKVNDNCIVARQDTLCLGRHYMALFKKERKKRKFKKKGVGDED